MTILLRHAAAAATSCGATIARTRLSMGMVQLRPFLTTSTLASTKSSAELSQLHHHPQQQSVSPRSFSSSTTDSNEKPSGIWNRVTTAFTDHQKKLQQQQFAAQMKKMAESEQWTIQDFINDISLSVDSWRAKVPGMSNTKEVQMAKQMNAIAKAIAQEMGPTVTATQLMSSGSATSTESTKKTSSSSSDSSGLSRTKKLKISIASGASVQDVNLMLQQFMSVQLMHSLVRKRFLENKPIPTDDVTMKRMLQLEGMASMSKSERKIMKELQLKKSMRGTGAGRQKK